MDEGIQIRLEIYMDLIRCRVESASIGISTLDGKHFPFGNRVSRISSQIRENWIAVVRERVAKGYYLVTCICVIIERRYRTACRDTRR